MATPKCCKQGIPNTGYCKHGERWKCPTCGSQWVHDCDEGDGCGWFPVGGIGLCDGCGKPAIVEDDGLCDQCPRPVCTYPNIPCDGPNCAHASLDGKVSR